MFRSILSHSHRNGSKYSKSIPAITTNKKTFTTVDPTKTPVKEATLQELTNDLAHSMDVQKGYKPIGKSRSYLLEYLPTSQKELPARSMQDSFTSAIIPLSTDLDLQEKYITFLGHVRLGRLLEDMDIFAVSVAQKHIKNPKLPEGKPTPYTLVTALVDRIDFSNYIPTPYADIRISGHVSWVGVSTIEVVVWLEQKTHSYWQKITRALFLMAARDPTNVKAAPVNLLKPANDREKKILAGGEARKARRKLLQSRQLTKVIPNSEEQKIMHDLYLRTVSNNDISLKKRILPSNGVWMDTCVLSNLIFSHPENRNLHNTVFGGFLMRQALELSWGLGYLFSKYRPILKSISDISFSRPVQVNSLVRMHAHVVFTQMQFFQITVYATMWNAVSGKNATANIFHFTYEVPEMVQEVFPRTYHEAMMFIDGRRHFHEIMTDESKSELDSQHSIVTSK